MPKSISVFEITYLNVDCNNQDIYYPVLKRCINVSISKFFINFNIITMMTTINNTLIILNSEFYKSYTKISPLKEESFYYLSIAVRLPTWYTIIAFLVLTSQRFLRPPFDAFFSYSRLPFNQRNDQMKLRKTQARKVVLCLLTGLQVTFF